MREEPSAVTNRTLEPEAEGGAGKTETEEPESSRNLLDERRTRITGRKGECILLPAN